jgi:hypothetical protein
MVFSFACDSTTIASLASKWRLSILSLTGETEKSRVDGYGSHVVCGKKFTGEKEVSDAVLL